VHAMRALPALRCSTTTSGFITGVELCVGRRYGSEPMRRSKQIRGLAHALLVFVFTSLGSLPQLALCTSAAGHHALELRDAACCGPVAAVGTGHSVRALPSGCAPDCSDTPLGVVAAAHRPEQIHGTVTETSYLPAVCGAAPLDRGCGPRAAAWPIPPLDFTLRVLRSTVALC